MATILSLGSSNMVLDVTREAVSFSPCSITSFCTTKLTSDRVQEMASLMQRDQQSILTVMSFAFKFEFVVSVFATLRYSSDAPEHQRYSVTNSAFELSVWDWALS